MQKEDSFMKKGWNSSRK